MKTRSAKTQKPRTKPAAKAAPPTVTLADVEAYLARQSKAHLLELLMEQVETDERLRERLLLKAARTAAKGLDLDHYRKAIFVAVTPDDYVSYREMWDYTSGIDEVVASIEDLLAEGDAAEVKEYRSPRVVASGDARVLSELDFSQSDQETCSAFQRRFLHLKRTTKDQ